MVMRAFAGTVSVPSPVITINATDYTRTVVDPSDATCSVTFSSTGAVSGVADNGTGYDWLTSGSPGDYSILFTTTAGTLSTGTAGTYQNLGTTRTFGVTRTTIGTKQWTGTATIRRDSDSVVMAGPTAISLTATVQSSDTGGDGGGGGGGGFGGGGGTGGGGESV
jgi:hypothetical protein